MSSWLKNIFIFLLGGITSLIVLCFFIIFIFRSFSEKGAGGMFNKTINTKIEKGTILVLPLQTAISEQGKENFIWTAKKWFREYAWLDIQKGLLAAEKDENITALWIQMGPMFDLSWPLAKEFRTALLQFQKSGKKIYFSSDLLTNKHYYLASAADQNYLTPEGYLSWNGLGVHFSFYKGLLDHLGLRFFVARGRDNDYKSYAEPFLYEKMSPYNKEQYQELINHHWDLICKEIGEQVHLSFEKLQQLSREKGIFSALEAEKEGLLTKAFYEDQVKNKIQEDYQLVSWNEISFRTYFKSIPSSEKKGNIAILYAEGDIQYGTTEEGIDRDFIKKIIRLREDTTVQSVVLRVNSPGGSALTSDLIWRELSLLKEKKTLIVSMAAYAASGGYYMALPAHKIYASPFTLTGSIGVFALFPTAEELFKKTGISFDALETGPYANLMKGFVLPEKITPEQQKILETLLATTYDGFLEKILQARSSFFKNLEAVHQVARGRVYTAAKAKQLGLIDEIGSLDQAIEAAAVLAKIENPKPFIYQNKTSAWQEIVGQFLEDQETENEESFMMAHFFQNIQNFYQHIKTATFKNPSSFFQARMPYEVEIQ